MEGSVIINKVIGQKSYIINERVGGNFAEEVQFTTSQVPTVEAQDSRTVSERVMGADFIFIIDHLRDRGIFRVCELC